MHAAGTAPSGGGQPDVHPSPSSSSYKESTPEEDKPTGNFSFGPFWNPRTEDGPDPSYSERARAQYAQNLQQNPFMNLFRDPLQQLLNDRRFMNGVQFVNSMAQTGNIFGGGSILSASSTSVQTRCSCGRVSASVLS